MHDYFLEGDPFRPPKKKKAREPERSIAPKIPSGHPKVIITDVAQRQYDELSANVRLLIDELIARLKDWPHVSGIRMIFGPGYAPGKFRMKTWDWRLEGLYNRPANEIKVLRIGHRDDFYDEYHP